MSRSNRRKGEPYTPRELVRSSRTVEVEWGRYGYIYSHTIGSMAGAYVVIWHDGIGWDTAATLADAQKMQAANTSK